ncbi:hypothetical protein HerbRD11066_30390 [Herbidospora sp. RD11066]
MDEDLHVGVSDRVGALGHDRPLEPLRITEEELDHLRLSGGGVRQRVVLVDMSSDSHHAFEPNGVFEGVSKVIVRAVASAVDAPCDSRVAT